MAVSLRPYQLQAIEAVVEARKRGLRRMMVCLPTGTGKTVIFAELASRAKHPVLVLAHRAELLQQARDKIARALGEDGLVAIEQGEQRAPASARVVVASIRSLHEGRIGKVLQGRDVRLVIYDECHHAAAPDNMRVLEQIGAFEPDWPGTLIGFTATTQRGDGQGLDSVFESIVYRRGLPEMIADGYLVPLRGYRIQSSADLRSVGLFGMDFDPEELAEAVNIEERNGLVARSILELARDRRTVVFCVTVAHARNLARTMNHLGLPTGIVHGEMRTADRERTLEELRSGKLAAVTNVGVLTEGFDDPEISCVAMARPTRSEGLYQQCVGRGTRLHPGKTDCLVLDFVDLSELSLVTLASLFGMPRDLDLGGEQAEQAAKHWQRATELLGIDLEEAASLTLREIQERAQSFDPLTARLDPEVVAISENAWISLGAAGLALHYQHRGKTGEYLVLDAGGRGKRWRVVARSETVARFSRLEEAVEAVDYEVNELGPAAEQSARPTAAWRSQPPTPEQRAALAALQPPQAAATQGEALRLLSWAAHAKTRPTRSKPRA
jgi:superfamily II DNA or RNA helicase